jgi:hypothetical protein
LVLSVRVLVQDTYNLAVVSFSVKFDSAISFCEQAVIAADTDIDTRVNFGASLSDND